MLTIDGKELRNLVEQVQKNKEDIANHYAVDRALSNLGIKVVGQVTTAAELPEAETYAGEYGDTYAVGSKIAVDAGLTSYKYYVFTRPDPNAGELTNYWLDVGSISIVGPQGVQGKQGPQGIPGVSNKWYTGDSFPANPIENDMYLANSGQVYQYLNSQWQLITNIKGPQGLTGPQGKQGIQGIQGEQGLKGNTGDTGGLVNIAGILANSEQLPTPAEVDNVTVAYLVGTQQPYDLYIQVGLTPATSYWTNTGAFNAATLVTVNGVGQNVWDANTKVDKPDSETNCVIGYNNSVGSFKILYTNTIPYQGRFCTPGSANDGVSEPAGDGYNVQKDPVNPYHLATKHYVDNGLAGKVDLPAVTRGYNRLCGIENGTFNVVYYDIQLPVYFNDYNATSIYGNPGYSEGRLGCADPIGDFDVVNKRTLLNSLGYTHYVTCSSYYYSGTFTVIIKSNLSTPFNAIWADLNGTFPCIGTITMGDEVRHIQSVTFDGLPQFSYTYTTNTEDATIQTGDTDPDFVQVIQDTII